MSNPIFEGQGEQPVNPAENEQVIAQAEQNDQARQPLWTRGRMAVAGALVIVGAGGVMLNSCSGDDSGNAPSSNKEAATMCADFESTNAAANPSKYNTPEAFFPKTGKVEKSDQVRSYIQSMFDKNGPLAGNGDEASLAAIMATVVTPAHDGAVTSENSSVLSIYNARIAAYNAKDGKKAAENDCKQAWDTLNQVAGYNANWAQKGEQITEVQAIRDVNNADESKRNNIIGMQLVPGVSIETLSGIQFKLNETSKKLDGFQEMLLSTNQKGELDGRIFYKGLTVGNVTLNPNGEPLVSVDQNGNPTELKVMPDGSIQVTTTNKDTGEVSTSTVPAQGNVNTGGAAGPNGTNPEAGPNGTTNSPAEGTVPGAGPQGPGTTVTSTPPSLPPITVTIPPQTTTTRPPSTTTTTRPPSTTTTTRPPSTTTTQPWKPPIDGCDPAFEVC